VHAESVKLFDMEVLNTRANEKGSSMSSDEVQKLPDISTLPNTQGKKNGEVKIYADNGKPVA